MGVVPLATPIFSVLRPPWFAATSGMTQVSSPTRVSPKRVKDLCAHVLVQGHGLSRLWAQETRELIYVLIRPSTIGLEFAV